MYPQYNHNVLIKIKIKIEKGGKRRGEWNYNNRGSKLVHSTLYACMELSQ
jgi:hypothetical protein